MSLRMYSVICWAVKPSESDRDGIVKMLSSSVDKVSSEQKGSTCLCHIKTLVISQAKGWANRLFDKRTVLLFLLLPYDQKDARHKT